MYEAPLAKRTAPPIVAAPVTASVLWSVVAAVTVSVPVMVVLPVTFSKPPPVVIPPPKVARPVTLSGALTVNVDAELMPPLKVARPVNVEVVAKLTPALALSVVNEPPVAVSAPVSVIAPVTEIAPEDGMTNLSVPPAPSWSDGPTATPARVVSSGAVPPRYTVPAGVVTMPWFDAMQHERRLALARACTDCPATPRNAVHTHGPA
jgi:hypothetical protein